MTLAFRALHFGRYGQDAESERLSPLYVGHDTLVRGYRLGSIDAASARPVPGDPQRLPGVRPPDRQPPRRWPTSSCGCRSSDARASGCLELPWLPTELAAFVDAGDGVDGGRVAGAARSRRDSIERVPVVSAGITARILLGGFAVLEFYYAVPFQRPDEERVTGFVIAPGW